MAERIAKIGEKKEHLNLTLDVSVVNWIDMFRGQVPRSTFINRVLSKIYAETRQVFNWEEEEAKADEDIKMGRVHKFSSAEDAIKWLRS